MPQFHREGWGSTYPSPQVEAARFQLTTIPIADHMLIAPHMVRKLPGFYPHATVRVTILDPMSLGSKSISQGGAFNATTAPASP